MNACDGGLIALTLEDASRLLTWGLVAFANEEPEFDGPDDVLFMRIQEWVRRHSEDIPG